MFKQTKRRDMGLEKKDEISSQMLEDGPTD